MIPHHFSVVFRAYACLITLSSRVVLNISYFELSMDVCGSCCETTSGVVGCIAAVVSGLSLAVGA